MGASPRGTLVIRPERLGDLVLCTPVLRACRATWPDEPLRVLTDDRHAALLEGFPGLDEIVAVPWLGRKRGQRAPWKTIYSALRSRPRPRRAIILYPGVGAWNYLMAALRVPEVAQLGGTLPATLLGHRMMLRRKTAPDTHYAELFLATAALLGAQTADRLPRIEVSRAETAALLARYPRLAGSGPHVLVHPFRPSAIPGLGEAGYRGLLTRLAGLGLSVHLVGAGEAARNWRSLERADIDEELLGRLTLRELMAACAVATVVVADSTGVIHLAAALGTPTFGFYCPRPSASPPVWGPLGAQAETMVASISFCRGCSPATGSCTSDGWCDLAAGVDLSTAADRIAAKAFVRAPAVAADSR